jgi:L-ascorbate metabolism protein UlaG (beta-lactamase superfamily)
MRIYFLHHSAAAVVLDESLLIFDHYINERKGMEYGTAGDDDLKSAGRVYVFASHSHYDHFNPAVFKWAKINPNITYILDSTIANTDASVNSVILSKGESFEDGYIRVMEFGSTDIGGSFFVQCEGKSFFHAGDFNYWHWRDDGDERYIRAMTKLFEREMKYIKENISGIDYAFFPLDSRMGSGYEEGPDIFIEAMKPRVFIPIHLKRFEDSQSYSKKQFEGTEILAINRNGQRLV